MHEQFDKEKHILIAENTTLKRTIQAVDGQIKQLQKESNDMRQYSRRDSLEIQWIPYQKEESTDDITKKVGDLMEVYLGDNDISISHRNIRFQGAKTWNAIKESLRKVGSLKKFKYNLKSTVIKSY